MKTKAKLALVAALYCGLSSLGSAFTLDFSSVSIGSSLPQTVNVPGYGSVTFQSLQGAVTLPGHLTVQSFAPLNQNAIEFQVGESILMTFLGAVPLSIQNQYAGVSSGESFSMTAGTDSWNYVVSFSGPIGATAGLQSVNFSNVQEEIGVLTPVLPVQPGGPREEGGPRLPPFPPKVPEPSTGLLGLVACVLCLVRRGR